MKAGYNFEAAFRSGDPYAPPFPELPPERKSAVEEAVVWFEGWDLHGVVVKQKEIWTHLEVCPFEINANRSSRDVTIASRVSDAEVECRPKWVCPCCDVVSCLGRPRDSKKRTRYRRALAGVPRLTVRTLDPAEEVPVFVLDSLTRWIRGWLMNCDDGHALLVESELTLEDVGCPVVDELGQVVRVVRNSDVNAFASLKQVPRHSTASTTMPTGLG